MKTKFMKPDVSDSVQRQIRFWSAFPETDWWQPLSYVLGWLHLGYAVSEEDFDAVCKMAERADIAIANVSLSSTKK